MPAGHPFGHRTTTSISWSTPGASGPPTEAVRRAPELFERFALRWLEEPLHEDDLAGYARLAAAAPGWIAAGETEEREADFAALLDAAA